MSLERMPDGPLSLGDIYYEKVDLNVAVGLWHMENRVEYCTHRSDSERVTYRCKSGLTCPFDLRARKKGNFWYIHKFIDKHTCNHDLRRVVQRKIGSSIIAAYFARRMRNQSELLKPRSIESILLNDFGIIASYSVCLRARNRAIEILFVAVAKDGNEGVVPLAWGIGPKENDISWTWFLSHVKRALGVRPDMMIISDAHISIANAVRDVYGLEVKHGLCYFHILKGLVCYGKAIAKLFHKAAYAYRNTVYEKAIESIHYAAPQAYAKLMTIGPEKWARCMPPVRRYGCLTSNGAESFNNALLWARRLPICSCLEAITIVVGKWFDDRRQLAMQSGDIITKVAYKKLFEHVGESRSYIVVPITRSSFKVHDGRNNLTIDLQLRACPCREFDLDLIPCSHAAVAIHASGGVVYDHVDYVYKRTTLIETYSKHANHVPPQDEWSNPQHIASFHVCPPRMTSQAGRPKNSRYRSAVENLRRPY